ncbi:MAG: ABC transporter permease, partial [Cytophagaceae bacterium]
MSVSTKPPKWANWLLVTFGHPDTQEEVEGDLLELYRYWVQTVGERRARWRYSLAALKLLRPLAQSKKSRDYPTHNQFSLTMIRNYAKIAWRNLTQSKGYSALTISGLALGLAVSLLSILYVADELSYDRYHEKADRIYRINSDISFSLNALKAASSPTPMGQTLKRDFPEVEEATRIRQGGVPVVT